MVNTDVCAENTPVKQKCSYYIVFSQVRGKNVVDGLNAV